MTVSSAVVDVNDDDDDDVIVVSPVAEAVLLTPSPGFSEPLQYRGTLRHV